MNLLAPAMLAGAAVLTVPVILHLIARHRFPVQDFPTIRLLRFERRANVFAWKLVDAKQLLLRLAVLALLVLAMARLFAPGVSSDPAPRNLVVVIDASASMRMEVKDTGTAGGVGGGGTTTLLDLARRRAAELLSEVRPPSRCAVLLAGDTTSILAPLDVDPTRALAAVAAVRPCDGTGSGLVRAVAAACELIRGRREVRSQIVVLTDLRSSAFEARDQWDLRQIARAAVDQGDRLEIALLDVSGGADQNVGIVDARLRGGQVRAGDDVHVIAHVVNAGPASRPADLRLSIGGQADPQGRSVPLAAGGEAFVDLTARVNRAQRMFGEVRLREHDALAIDDQFVLPVEVADVRRVLIVRGASEQGGADGLGGGLERLGAGGAGPASKPAMASGASSPSPAALEDRIDGATILRYVLNPGRELGATYSTGIDTTMVTAEALPAQPLSKYDIVALYDVSSLPEKVLGDLDTFVRQGKSVLIVCSGGCGALRFNKTLAAGAAGRAALSPAQIGNDLALNPPAGIDAQATGHPILAPFRDRLQGDLSVVRLATVRQIRSQASDARVALRATDGTPLAIERQVDQGRVMLLTFGTELDRSNIARSRAFPAIMWRIADYLTGRLQARPPDVLPAGEMRVLDVSETPFAFETALELTRVRTDGEGAAGEPKEARGTGGTSQPATRAAVGAAPTSREAASGAAASGTHGEGPSGIRTLVERLTISPERQVVLQALPAGRYQIDKARPLGGAGTATQVVGYSRPVAINPDAREGRMARTDAAELRSLFGPQARVLTPDRLGELVPRGGEFWTVLVVLLLLAYAIEAAAGWIACVRSERRRQQTSGVAADAPAPGKEEART